ncbi:MULTISPECIES: XisH family protein [unclassified Coleofasciculus]|uniref:XisH family protein n=1 Tax=unclassified Coleofasciculus TaxID=2692782 RepID=UPI00188248FD|nr:MULTISPECIES: XisH family protein [unclassified Coleofasciculus]MBE9127482.1 XisH family protein [Coleofasciculus sp. LEGE 07081]MBE9150754.1 XisH family protein [Coleofasciculus sp. LEGE 07092]
MAKDLFHDVVKEALLAEGWQITHDPFPIDYGDVQMQIDLGAERLLAAERDTEKIAVEVKSFINPSAISEFHTAVGQYLNYRRALRVQETTRILYLAVPSQTYEEFFRLRFIQEGVIEYQLYLVIYDVEDRRIVQWIK